MIWIVLSVITNAFIGVIFKFFGKYQINNLFAIAINYFVCVITASLVLGTWAIPENVTLEPWFPIALILGILFPIIFNLYALSIQKIGIVISTIFQRMSLIAPVILAILYYGEPFNIMKGLGIAAAITSIFLIPMEDKKSGEVSDLKKYLWIPFSVFLGSAMIDSGLLITERMEGSNTSGIPFVATLFLFAGIGASLIFGFRQFKVKSEIRKQDFIAGICLGIPNFFSIFLIMKALSSGFDGSIFFPINNVGILALSTLVGIFWFREKMNIYRYIGFAISILAIVILANS